MNISHLQRFAELAESKRALETSLEKVKEELSQLETGLLQEFEEDGVPSVKLNRPDGTMTIYLHRQLWAGAIEGDYPRACRALVNAGLEELVQTRFNTNQVSAAIREMTKKGEPIPTMLSENLSIAEKFSLRTRR